MTGTTDARHRKSPHPDATKPPRRAPKVTWLALLLGLALVALAVLTVRDLSVSQGWSGGSPWLSDAVSSVDGSQGTGVVVVGVVLALVGLLLLLAALMPGKQTHRPASDSEDLWISPRAMVDLGVNLADRTEGVVSASGRSRKKGKAVEIDVATWGSGDQVKEKVEQRLDAAGLREMVDSTTWSVNPVEVDR